MTMSTYEDSGPDRGSMAERVRKCVLADPRRGFWMLSDYPKNYPSDLSIYTIEEFKRMVRADPWGCFIDLGPYAGGIDEGLKYVLWDPDRSFQDEPLMSISDRELAETCAALVLGDDRLYKDLVNGEAPVPVAIREAATGVSRNAKARKTAAKKPSGATRKAPAARKTSKAHPKASKTAKRDSGRPGARGRR